MGSNKLISTLRILTSIELFSFSEFYYRHSIFTKVFEEKFFEDFDSVVQHAVSFKAGDTFKIGKDLIEEEAMLGCVQNEWCSFVTILALSSVIRRVIYVYYPDYGASKLKSLF